MRKLLIALAFLLALATSVLSNTGHMLLAIGTGFLVLLLGAWLSRTPPKPAPGR